MYAAHFAAGLAIGARAPRAPMWALLAGAFLPDVAWIGLSCAGVEPAGTGVFFDDWSHSLVSVLILATLFALCFVRSGRGVWLAIWLAVASHFVLDAPIHPRPLALYPHAAIRVPWDLWHWGETPWALGFSHYWWVQLAVTLTLLAVYVAGVPRRNFAPNLAWATVLLVLGLHLVF
jgi:hypothetical protein